MKFSVLTGIAVYSIIFIEQIHIHLTMATYFTFKSYLLYHSCGRLSYCDQMWNYNVLTDLELIAAFINIHTLKLKAKKTAK